MKFMMLVKGAESQGPPPRALMEAIDRLSQEDPKDGMVRLDSGGLYPSAASTRVRVDETLATARFYATRLLPQVHSLAASVASGAEVVMRGEL